MRFDGKGNWNTFVYKFYAFLQQNGVSNDCCKLNFLKQSLDGSAIAYFDLLSDYIDSISYPFLENFDDLLFVLGECQYEQSPIAIFFEAFQERREEIYEWACRTSVLAQQAFPDLTVSALEEVAAHKFYRQLQSEDSLLAGRN